MSAHVTSQFQNQICANVTQGFEMTHSLHETSFCLTKVLANFILLHSAPHAPDAASCFLQPFVFCQHPVPFTFCLPLWIR